MYKRIDELLEFKQNNNLGLKTFASMIGINELTLQKVIKGESIFKSTEMIIDSFLDSKKIETIDISKLLKIKGDRSILKFSIELSENIGISKNTVYNILKGNTRVSKTTKKIINNYINSFA